MMQLLSGCKKFYKMFSHFDAAWLTERWMDRWR